MTKVSIGIDMAKDKCDIAVIDLEQGQRLEAITYPNTAAGHQHLIEHLAGYQVVHLVMEATGTYHLRLSKALAQADLLHAVINPLQLKRFAQMKLRRIKTDRSDAVLLAEYGREQKPPFHHMQPVVVQQLKQLNTHIEQLVKQRTALKNLCHASAELTDGAAVCTEVVGAVVSQLDQGLAQLKAAQQQLAASAYAEVKALIESVVGVGQRTALALLAYLGTLHRFESHKQVVAYMGLNPVPMDSGTSLQAPRHISKQGNARLRTLFYLCALSAKRHNRVCKALYDRQKAAGKAEKVALIAVANKLVKQVFTVVKKGVPFDNHYLEKASGRLDF